MLTKDQNVSEFGVKADGPILFFDSNCLLCNRSVQFILQYERQHHLRFAPISGKTWQQIFGISEEQREPLTLVFVNETGAYTKSEGVVQILRAMGGKWSTLGRLASIVPKSVRDNFYNLIARNRYKWFGKAESCLMPSPEMRNRFLE